MVDSSTVLIFLLVLGGGQSELDTKITSSGEAAEWEDPDLSLQGSCQPVPSCQKCILSHPSCAWCKQLNFTASGEAEARRCARREELLARGCPAQELEEPRGRQEVLQDKPLSQGDRGEGATQLAPQRIRVTLRPGEPQKFRVRFLRAAGYPVDLYYLMDLSYSMKDDLERVRQLGHALLVRLQEVTHSVRIGFGSFVDKTVLPFVSTVPSKLHHPCPSRLERCQPPFSFHHVLSLTGDAQAFEREVGRQNVSGNLDSPEGGFDAILCGGFGHCQCGVCHCHANHTGRACECSKSVDSCVSPEGGLCSGHGYCKCNRCQCLDGYYGALCDQCLGCKSPCEQYRDCAECGAFGTGPLAANCSVVCADVNVTLTLAPNLDDGWCKERTIDNQLFFFLVEHAASGIVLRVRPQERQQSSLQKCDHNHCQPPLPRDKRSVAIPLSDQGSRLT